MKTILAFFISSVLATRVAFAAEWPPASEYTYETICDQQPKEKECLQNAKSFEGYYNRAIKGEYEGQRMVALAFGVGMEGILPRPTLACAWNLVILRSGHLEATPDDTSNTKYNCDKLNSDERTLAEAQANRILKMLGQ